MITLSEAQRRALVIAQLYDELNRGEYGREWSRKDLTLGFVGDVGDLVKLVQAKEGVRAIDDLDARLAHELADCLWSVLVLADRYGVDLERAFLETMDQLEAQLA